MNIDQALARIEEMMRAEQGPQSDEVYEEGMREYAIQRSLVAYRRLEDSAPALALLVVQLGKALVSIVDAHRVPQRSVAAIDKSLLAEQKAQDALTALLAFAETLGEGGEEAG